MGNREKNKEKWLKNQRKNQLVTFNRYDEKDDLDISDRYDKKDGTLWYKNTKNQQVNCNNLACKCKSGKTTYFGVINKPEELSEGIKTLKY